MISSIFSSNENVRRPCPCYVDSSSHSLPLPLPLRHHVLLLLLLLLLFSSNVFISIIIIIIIIITISIRIISVTAQALLQALAASGKATGELAKKIVDFYFKVEIKIRDHVCKLSGFYLFFSSLQR